MDKEYYKQLCKKSQVHLQEIQKELEGQGVIRRYQAFGKKERDMLYQLSEKMQAIRKCSG